MKWETLTASISLTIAIISAWVAYETFYLQNQSKRPQIVLTIDSQSRHSLFLLVCQNLGEKAAFNFKFTWTRPLLDLKGNQITFKSNPKIVDCEIPVLNAKEKLSIIVDEIGSFYKKNKDDSKYYSGTISFQESLTCNKKTSYNFQFSFEQYSETPLSESELPKTLFEIQKIPKNLEDIKAELQKLRYTIENNIK
ncbi:hypothetical protein [Larkinella humicola]|uniref:Uncharacterized protein n=1 Tax=Larkinella humicola TaxID=2607654 RepID=A0A5N1JMB2_9BACT|nr:hypothetical protein [Larkinella humicola]KAA9357008.1 hypothetical protein F0P93_04530 [Larkinella humicola]